MIEINYYKNFLHPIGFQFSFLLWDWETEPHYIDTVGVELKESGSAGQGFRSLVCITTSC